MGAQARELAEAEYDRELLARRFVAWLEGAIP